MEHVIITTETGSKYEINDLDKTWKRITIGNDAYTTRTPDGNFNSRSDIVIGRRFSMLADGLEVHGATRLIETTNVVDVEHL